MFARPKFSISALCAGILFFTFTSCAPSLAMDEDWENFLPHSGQSLLDMLNQQDVVEVTLTADLDSLIDNRKSEEYLPARFNYEDAKGVRHAYNIKVRPRGKFRRKVCDFPPLKLKFSKEELEAAGLNEMNELKLVTHCLDDKNQGNDQVLREYLIYKMYNELTPMSLRVQLVKVTYRDSEDSGKKLTRWGFLIEDEEELEYRNGGVVCDCMGRQKEDFQPTHERLNALFQYMIGNTDWSLEMQRNVEMLRIGEGKLIPVPYDFDFSALVQAPYARPNGNVGQRNIQQRVFMGHAESAEEMYSTISYFKTKKQAMLDVVSGFKLLGREEKAEMLDFIESFYQDIESPEIAQEMLFTPLLSR